MGITVVQTSTVSDLGPGRPAQRLGGTFDNPDQGPVYVTSVSTAISGITKAPGASAGECTAADYVVTGSPMTVGRQIDPGTSQGEWGGAMVQFDNALDHTQDACKNAILTFAYTSN